MVIVKASTVDLDTEGTIATMAVAVTNGIISDVHYLFVCTGTRLNCATASPSSALIGNLDPEAVNLFRVTFVHYHRTMVFSGQLCF